MKGLLSLSALMLCSFIISCRSVNIKQDRILLKEYAYCKCLEFATGDTALFKRDISLSVYREIASYQSEVYIKVDSLAQSAASKIKPSTIADHENKKTVFLDCFNFFKSEKLDSLVKTMDKMKLESWKQ